MLVQHIKLGLWAIALGAILSGPSFAQVDVIAHWSFDTPNITIGDNGRILTAADSTGNHNATGVYNGDITLANVTSTPGPFGQAAMFTNGTGAQATNNASFTFPQLFEIMGPDAGDFTVAAWVNTTDTTTTKAIIADWGNAPAGTHRFTYWFPIHNSQPRGQIRWANSPPDDTGGVAVDVIATTVGGTNASGVSTVADGQWHHVAFVWEQEPGQMHFYLDGLFAQTSTTARNPEHRFVLESASEVGAIGRKSDTNNFMIGALDEIWVLGGALSAEEVLLLKNENSVDAIIAGDVNGDEIVDINDFNIIRDNFQQPGARADGDLSGDGFVNLNDFRRWKTANYAPMEGAAAGLGGDALPEPGSLVLVLLAVAGLLSGRSHRGR